MLRTFKTSSFYCAHTGTRVCAYTQAHVYTQVRAHTPHTETQYMIVLEQLVGFVRPFRSSQALGP